MGRSTGAATCSCRAAYARCGRHTSEGHTWAGAELDAPLCLHSVRQSAAALGFDCTTEPPRLGSNKGYARVLLVVEDDSNSS